MAKALSACQYLFLALGMVLVAAVMAAAVMFGGQTVQLAVGLAVAALLLAGLAFWEGHCWIRLVTICILWRCLSPVCWCILPFSPVLCRTFPVFMWLAGVAERLASSGSQPAAIAAAGYHEPSLVFLLGRDVLLVDSREAALFLAEAPDGVALVEARQQAAFLDMARRLGLRLAVPEQLSGYNMSKGQDVVILIYRREMFDATLTTSKSVTSSLLTGI